MEDEDVSWLLFRLAREACLGEPGDVEEAAGEPASDFREGGRPGEARLRKVLLSLDRRALQCLVLWGEPQHGLIEISKLLRMSPEDVRTRLAVVAMRLERPVEALRSPELLELCRAILRGD